ncbi:ankyrin [Epithele typhae]|uniref:ankyrin n=1 Tax=Epithele typhae TaxID=378194 RepID=UPI0020084697|nr:ankyrin [Epithele typhae]KAH9918246.1 ankyrin [Epithele typhae]
MAEKDATVRLRRAVQDAQPRSTQKRYTSLAWAAVLGHEETFEYLLSSGHDDHEYSKDAEDNTILNLLAGARPQPSGHQSKSSSEQDFLGATLRMARMYIDRFPDVVDWANVEGKTPLHVAALKGNEELVRMLCDLGADVDLADNEGNTPLHYASSWGHITIVQLLIERGCQYHARNNQGFTPSDYAYSVSTRETLQDTARIQFEINKKARRGVFQQAAARGSEWGGNMQVYPPSPRENSMQTNGGSVRMRSGSGTSHTTTTSNSGDALDNGVSAQSSSRFWSSPSRRPAPLPSGTHSPGQPSASSTSSAFGFASSPVSQPSSATLLPTMTTNAAAALSPIATRMRERDADAMEKYKLRQRSGSATTASTDTPSQHEPASSPPPAPPPKEPTVHHHDDISALGSHVLARVALACGHEPLSAQARKRSRRPSPSLTADASGSSSGSALATPTQNSTVRPGAHRAGSSSSSTNMPLYAEMYTGPPSEYARFPPPPRGSREREGSSGGGLIGGSSSSSGTADPERSATPTTANAPGSSRRLPFNLLGSHKHSMDGHVPSSSHRRNASVNAVVR